MSIVYRQAKAEDAMGVYDVADSVSRKVLEGNNNKDSLSDSGFLMYPLSAANDSEPNYRERIIASKFFWVACEYTRVIAFTMAYTFDCFQTFRNKTKNDIGTIEYFTKNMGILGSTIYFAQIGVRPEYKRKNLARDLVNAAYGDIDGSKNPSIICEIAQAPLWNKASTLAAIALGFSPMFLREKDTHLPKHERRISGTFVKTFSHSKYPKSGFTE